MDDCVREEVMKLVKAECAAVLATLKADTAKIQGDQDALDTRVKGHQKLWEDHLAENTSLKAAISRVGTKNIGMLAISCLLGFGIGMLPSGLGWIDYLTISVKAQEARDQAVEAAVSAKKAQESFDKVDDGIKALASLDKDVKRLSANVDTLRPDIKEANTVLSRYRQHLDHNGVLNVSKLNVTEQTTLNGTIDFGGVPISATRVLTDIENKESPTLTALVIDNLVIQKQLLFNDEGRAANTNMGQFSVMNHTLQVDGKKETVRSVVLRGIRAAEGHQRVYGFRQRNDHDPE